MAKITQSEYDALPDSVKESFTKEGEDYILKTEDVSGLKTALENERKARKTAETAAKKFEGLDADEIKKILADKAKSDEDEKKKAGQFDEILKAKEEDWKKQLDSEKARADKAENNFRETIADTAIIKALSANGIIADRIEAAKVLMKQSVVVEEKDGAQIVKFKDASGYAQEMKPEDFGAKWRESHGYFFSANGKGGSDDRNGESGFDGKTVKFGDQAAMSANIEDIASGKVEVK